MKILHDANKILTEDGIAKLAHGFVWFTWSRTLRRIMPLENRSNPILIEDVKTVNKGRLWQQRVGDRIIGWKPIGFEFDRHSQHGEANAHQILTNEGDQVSIIGGGYGITTVHAARQVGGGGVVTVFEGGQIASEVRQVAQWNEVDDVVTVEEAIVGDPTTLYQGMADDAEVIDPADLPACDVLEMDCEGSELGILEGMQIRPRVLIVELHPTRYDAPNATPVELIEEMGYEMVYWSTHNGERMSEQEFLDRLADGCSDILAAVRE
jgi:hypothetical protein